jgi:hypothetical protein
VNELGGLKALFVVGAALVAAGCSPGAGEQSAPPEKHFDVTGWGALKPGMSKKDALATGELAATGAGKFGSCEDHLYQGGPAPDPKQLADESTKGVADRTEVFTANGGVRFFGETIHIILPPPGATATQNVGVGATVDQLKAAYPDAVGLDDRTFQVPVPEKDDWVPSFRFTDGKVTSFVLFALGVECV